MTSVARSKQLGVTIGLAYVAPEQAKPGSEFDIKISASQRLKAQTVATPFYDPDNLRQEL